MKLLPTVFIASLLMFRNSEACDECHNNIKMEYDIACMEYDEFVQEYFYGNVTETEVKYYLGIKNGLQRAVNHLENYHHGAGSINCQ